MADHGNAPQQGSVEGGEQPFVFDADIEAAEAWFANMARWRDLCIGALGAAILGVGLATCGSASLRLAALAAAAVGVCIQGALGWWRAGCMIASIRERTGALAAHGVEEDLWGARSVLPVPPLWRWWRPEPDPDEVPPGMTVGEYKQGRTRAKKEGCRLGAVHLAVAGAWLVLLVLGARALTGSSGRANWLVMGAWTLTLLGSAGGWLLRWRRDRDTVARWAGALTMDEFMRTRSWEWH